MIFGKLFNSAAKAIGLKLAVRFVRDVADGKKGPRAQRVYQFFVGKKRYTGFVLSLVAAVLYALNEQAAVSGLLVVAGACVQFGALDAAWRSTVPEWLTGSRAFQLARRLAPDIVALLGAGLIAVHEGYLAFGWSAQTWEGILLGAAAVFVQVGLIPAAWDAQGPGQAPPAAPAGAPGAPLGQVPLGA